MSLSVVVKSSLVNSSEEKSNTSASSAASSTNSSPAPNSFYISKSAADEPIKGSEIIVEALSRQGVTRVFNYPGGCSVDIDQALTRSKTIKNILARHEQGGVFSADGYARVSGSPGVCITSAGPGATNLLTGLQNAMFDSIPIVAITGQVPMKLIGTHAFQETPIIEITKSITKHNYQVQDVKDIPRIVKEAFFIATSGRPGPVLIDVPKDIQQAWAVPDWEQPMKLHSYISRLPQPPTSNQLEAIVRLISESKKPVLYVGGGCLDSSDELRRFVELTGIPVANTLMGIGVYPYSCDHDDDEFSLQMLGMHGTVQANYAINSCDLLLALGVRFDDRATGKVEEFARRAKIVHVDIDSSEIGKIKKPYVSVCADLKLVLIGSNKILEQSKQPKLDHFSPWRQELLQQKKKHPMKYKTFGDHTIPPQYAIEVLDELITYNDRENTIISSGVGQHQMWAAQYYKHQKPRNWVSSSGFGAMGFGLPAAIGAAIAKPDAVIVDIDGDGSLLMNIQELATLRVEKLPVKIMVLNNQYLGMVVEWENEDRLNKVANMSHTYLGNIEKEWEIFPNMLKFAEACDIPAARVSEKAEVKAAIKKMLDTPGPYLLDVIVTHQAVVRPMIPSGGSFKDIII
ncbi:acetolactate synthase 1, chloroplastic-like [Impatiens glandulifera]|uniref:acetolactate synthase 1, chloroplastic-like n=1 Tax=Impatiens glandulifera TaxID=253017 RepID=UPI001FB0CD45|nr:acetolactate synthase 1, chloroplastic-like [Impatiens glandulifera]